jgi:hypothetical protein
MFVVKSGLSASADITLSCHRSTRVEATNFGGQTCIETLQVGASNCRCVVFVAFGGLTDGLTDNCLTPILFGLALMDLENLLASFGMK